MTRLTRMIGMIGMIRLVLALACCLLPSLASAQAITSYTLAITAPGSPPVLISTTVIQAIAVTCNQAPPVGGSAINPTRAVFDDPANVGMVCIWTDPGSGPLSTLPFGATSYTATLIATDSAGDSPASVASPPFTHPGLVRPAPTGLRLIH